MTGALDGILVVALEQAVAAPYCSSRLADAGARVIKVERTGGDFARHYDRVAQGESAYFVWLNRGKESITLDIKQADDRALLARMVARADVFIQNLGPGAAARAGFGSDDLRARAPRLITCDISGYGEDGPYAGMKAYDLLVQAEVGLASITGTADEMARVGVSVADIAAGMHAQAAILEALIARSQTGEGRGIKLSLFAALADWMTVPLLHFDYGGAAPQRAGLNHPSIAPYGAYPYKDGLVLISIQNAREWVAFYEQVLMDGALTNDPRFHDNTARVANRAALDQLIVGVFTALSRTALVARLTAAGTAYGMVNGVDGLSKHPQLRRMSVETPSGPVNMPMPPASMGDAPAPRLVPAIGAHTDALRREFS
ncbi:MAG: itaconate CoA-transferase [Alphaproteobacteria bacterium]|jgi:itaconate CoA-transferase